MLCGAGNRDGSEITEAVSLLVSLTKCGAEPLCFAPDLEFQALNFLTHEPLPGDKRNTRIEAARISRGQCEDWSKLQARDYEGLALCGGGGAARLMSTWMDKGAEGQNHPELSRILRDFHRSGKPILGVCIAPALIALELGSSAPTLTLGAEDGPAAAELKKTGALHEPCPVDDFVTDRENKLISTPAFMLDADFSQVFHGISRAVKELVEMA